MAAAEDTSEGMLAPYRVLDLTDVKGQPCGKILADLGADVVKLEPPTGDPARRRAPFLDDDPHPDKGLYWLAYNAGKRGITLDLESEEGREAFLNLAAGADIVLESFTPGRLDALGIGYAALAAVNARIVLVSITPFGQTGPHAGYRGSDIVTWAMGGLMSICGEPTGPPAQVRDDAQSYNAASGDAAVGALLALEQRRHSGRGQHVDVSIQESVIRSTFQITASWDMLRRNLARGDRPTFAKTPWAWSCCDGYVLWIFAVGAGTSTRSRGFFDWLRTVEGGEAVLALDFDAMDPYAMSQAEWDEITALASAIFARFTKAELYAAALEYRFSLYPFANTADSVNDRQLAARDFWQEIAHPELDRTIRYPGPFAKATGPAPRVGRRAPLLGEHNAEVQAEVEAGVAGLSATSVGPSVADDPATSRPAPPLPLSGVKVLDMSWFMVGPMTTKPLADYGADVVHIESSVRVDAQRTPGPFKDDIRTPEHCGDYGQVRTSQRSITIDIAKPGGHELVMQLARWADIVVDNFAAGTMDRLGYGYEALRAVNPAVIMLSCCGQGQTGPHNMSKGGGGHYAALAGFNDLTGWPDGEPGYLGAYTDFVAPRFNVSLLLAALDYRRRTGCGQYFDVSQCETSMHWLAPMLLDYTANGRIATRAANRQAQAAPHGAYPCHDDRWCVIAVRDEQEWAGFRAALGDPAWAREPRFARHADRKANEDALDALVTAWTRTLDPDTVMRRLQAAGVGAGVVQRGEELIEHDPQLRHRGFWQVLAHPTLGDYHAPQHAFQLPDAPLTLRRSRMIGEDTSEVLQSVLGMSEDEIAELAAAELLQ